MLITPKSRLVTPNGFLLFVSRDRAFALERSRAHREGVARRDVALAFWMRLKRSVDREVAPRVLQLRADRSRMSRRAQCLSSPSESAELVGFAGLARRDRRGGPDFTRGLESPGPGAREQQSRSVTPSGFLRFVSLCMHRAAFAQRRGTASVFDPRSRARSEAPIRWSPHR